jgi:hypothetical protein
MPHCSPSEPNHELECRCRDAILRNSSLAAQAHFDLVQLAQQHGVQVVDLLVHASAQMRSLPDRRFWLSSMTYAALGTEVDKLDGEMKRIPVKVARFPHSDPDKTRVRA